MPLLKTTITTALGLALCLPTLGQAAEKPFDGRWSVRLVCTDTQDKNGALVKGYEYTFFVSIQDGVLQGEYGAPGHPASVSYTGKVSDDGTAEVRAAGTTGRSDYTVGRVAQGTQYGYTLHGKLAAKHGELERREVRPCTAILDRN